MMGLKLDSMDNETFVELFKKISKLKRTIKNKPNSFNTKEYLITPISTGNKETP